jgi:hypothetical protein
MSIVNFEVKTSVSDIASASIIKVGMMNDHLALI